MRVQVGQEKCIRNGRALYQPIDGSTLLLQMLIYSAKGVEEGIGL